MPTTMEAPAISRHSNSDADSVSSLTLVQIAERLEKVTAQIEAERTKERDARQKYREVADAVEARITAIKSEAGALVREQQSRLASFDGMLSRRSQGEDEARQGFAAGRRRHPLDAPANIGEAILRLWTLPEHDEPLTTDEIAEGLSTVGYDSKAAPRSLRSAVNQALAKLVRDGKVDKYRQDGSIIGRNEHGARARKYKSRG